jgi:hypothetical protein
VGEDIFVAFTNGQIPLSLLYYLVLRQRRSKRGLITSFDPKRH